MELVFNGQKFTISDLEKIVKEISGSDYSAEMLTVLTCALNNPQLLPKSRSKEVNNNELESYLKFWIYKYINGFNNRASKKQGNPSKTIPDTLSSYIYKRILSDSTEAEIQTAVENHSLLMTIENIIGELLEEYLSNKLKSKGWCCCWGMTIKKVDFCKADGTLLQIKTSDNSENSSSSDIRKGTTILKWARRKSTKKEEYYWSKLQEITGVTDISESDFLEFVNTTITTNPKCIYINPE